MAPSNRNPSSLINSTILLCQSSPRFTKCLTDLNPLIVVIPLHWIYFGLFGCYNWQQLVRPISIQLFIFLKTTQYKLCWGWPQSQSNLHVTTNSKYSKWNDLSCSMWKITLRFLLSSLSHTLRYVHICPCIAIEQGTGTHINLPSD